MSLAEEVGAPESLAEATALWQKGEISLVALRHAEAVAEILRIKEEEPVVFEAMKPWLRDRLAASSLS